MISIIYIIVNVTFYKHITIPLILVLKSHFPSKKLVFRRKSFNQIIIKYYLHNYSFFHMHN